MKNLLFAVPFALLGLASAIQAQTASAPYRLLTTIPIGGEGGWDFLTLDPADERLYVAHGTQTEVIDLKTKKLIGSIPNTSATACKRGRLRNSADMGSRGFGDAQGLFQQLNRDASLPGATQTQRVDEGQQLVQAGIIAGRSGRTSI